MRIQQVRPLENHILELTYVDGSIRVFDMKPLVTMKPWHVLRSEPLFKQAKADFNTVTWPGGLDIAPETLWIDSVAISNLVYTS